VLGYIRCAKYGHSGEIYNIGSGYAVSISKILHVLLSLSNKKITVITDPTKYRPIDVPIVEANISKIFQDTGWKPTIPLEQSLKSVLEYWRNKN
jgi:GDP-4-dehydro-6-deoxy-D-mannose reductase